MSLLKLKEILLRGGTNPLSNFLLKASDTVAGKLVVQRGAAGGGYGDILEISPAGDLILPSALGEAHPRGAVMQMMLAKVLPTLVPAVWGQRSFVKTGGKTLAIRAGTTVIVGGMFKTYTAQTSVVMPETLTPGEDYGIWALPSGVLFAAADPRHTPYAPTPAQAGAVKVGGFHYGLLAHDALLGGGGFAQAAPSMIWTQADVDKIAGINAHSMWDEGFRPECDPRGMTCVSTGSGQGLFWVDIYFCGTNHIVNGTSRYNTDVASGTVLPRIPLMFGGNGTNTYSKLAWFEAQEIALSHGKRLMSYQEFAAAAFGTTENQSLGGAASTIPATGHTPGYMSKWGIPQVTGHHWTYGDVAHADSGTAWVTGADRGQTYGTPVRAIFGGSRDSAASSGSRCSYWNSSAWYSAWNLGLRAACDHKRCY